MTARFSLEKDNFTLRDYNRARPFSSFLPGIAGEHGKPLWLFYTNRGQCVSSFGVRNRNGALLEFYPANKAYISTPLLGFRTFFLIGSGPKAVFYEPFRAAAGPGVEQTLRIRPQEIEIEEIHQPLGLKIRVVVFNAPNERLPLLVRQVEIENLSKKPKSIVMADGLPQVVAFGLPEGLLKQMSRTMEAFTEVVHGKERLPFFKLKTEPSDKPDVTWIHGGFFNFSFLEGKPQRILTDPKALFGQDTSFEDPRLFREGRAASWSPRLASLTPAAFSLSRFPLGASSTQRLHSYYGQADEWSAADTLRRKIQKDRAYAQTKRTACAALISSLTDAFALHSGIPVLDPYSRQTFLDNTLRGGKPWVIEGNPSKVFHYYSRKHGDMERDYNFFEVSPTYFSQGNGNFRDVNQNRRSEALLYPGVGATNVETFFNLLQLDGYNPLVIQFEKFSVPDAGRQKVEALVPVNRREAFHVFLSKPFNPGELFEQLQQAGFSMLKAQQAMDVILSEAQKIQDASHGEGYWIDHWTYNLDLLENFASVYPDQLKWLWVKRRDFTYFDNDHVVQPRHKKYVKRSDGAVRQLHAVLRDDEKTELIRHRKEDPFKVRTLHGQGAIYKSSLLAKVVGLLSVKASTLDPFGTGIEMEADKPGWCDALNGMPGLLGSSVSEAFELRRWVSFVREQLPSWLQPHEMHPFATEVADFVKSVRDALALAKPADFYKTWDTLCALRERFRETTRLGISGEETSLSREDIESLLDVVAKVLDAGLTKAFLPNGLCTTYFINEASDFEILPAAVKNTDDDEKPVVNVRVSKFKQIPVSPFLEGPVHALRVIQDPVRARTLYRAVKASDLYDRKLSMFRLNVPLTRESFEIGRNKIFPPGWLENESIFLHMAYKFLLETLRSGLVEEFFKDFRSGLVAFQKPSVYGRSLFENSSFIASSRFADARVHGVGFVARLTGATAEWISLVLHMGLGSKPFRWQNGQLSFEPAPILPAAFFTKRATAEFPKNSFGFKLFSDTWMVYLNPSLKDTFGARPLTPSRYALVYKDKDRRSVLHEGRALPQALAQDLRKGHLARVTITLEPRS